jgi:hypothetical protein
MFERVLLDRVVMAVRCGSCYSDHMALLAARSQRTVLEPPIPRHDLGLAGLLSGWRNPIRPRDQLDRQIPRRFSIATLLAATGGAAQRRVRRVPAAAVAEDGEDEEGVYAFITCPCRHRPVARVSLSKCDGCERWYFLLGTSQVYVIYGDMRLPPLRGSPAATS